MTNQNNVFTFEFEILHTAIDGYQPSISIINPGDGPLKGSIHQWLWDNPELLKMFRNGAKIRINNSGCFMRPHDPKEVAANAFNYRGNVPQPHGMFFMGAPWKEVEAAVIALHDARDHGFNSWEVMKVAYPEHVEPTKQLLRDRDHQKIVAAKRNRFEETVSKEPLYDAYYTGVMDQRSLIWVGIEPKRGQLVWVKYQNNGHNGMASEYREKRSDVFRVKDLKSPRSAGVVDMWFEGGNPYRFLIEWEDGIVTLHSCNRGNGAMHGWISRPKPQTEVKPLEGLINLPEAAVMLDGSIGEFVPYGCTSWTCLGIVDGKLSFFRQISTDDVVEVPELTPQDLIEKGAEIIFHKDHPNSYWKDKLSVDSNTNLKVWKLEGEYYGYKCYGDIPHPHAPQVYRIGTLVRYQQIRKRVKLENGEWYLTDDETIFEPEIAVA